MAHGDSEAGDGTERMSETEIVYLHGRRVWDSRGRPTVEAEVLLAGGAVGRAIAPAGASTGAAEAHDLRDGGETFGGFDVTRAVASVNGEIAGLLMHRDAADQAAIDTALIELDSTATKSRLGANATIAVSMAVAHAAAGAAGAPLYRHLGGDEAALLPLPQIQILGGGAHAASKLDIQDIMVICPGARSFAEALDWTAEVYRAAGSLLKKSGRVHGVADEGGWFPEFRTNEESLETVVRAIDAAGFEPGEEVALALDIAATSFFREGRYRLALEGRDLDRDGMIALLTGWLDAYPICSIEDPLVEEDWDGFAAFTKAVGSRVQVVGDDFLVSHAGRLRDAARRGAGNAIVLKPNQRGTLTEIRQAWEAARELGYAGIVSARSGETEDTTIVHLAVGWGIPQLKVGSMARGERTAKWNEALRIEEAMGPLAKFAGAKALAGHVRA
jgi:enolase